jgi:hypothetical protein
VRTRRSSPPVLEPLAPKRKWLAILAGTLLLLPAYWGIVTGLVSATSERPDAPPPAPSIALGLALLPFVFIALAFTSQHPRAPTGVLKGMGLSLLIGIPATAIAPDAISGLIAGIGAGGAAALRPEPGQTWRPRVAAVAAVTLYVFVMVRLLPVVTLLLAPTLPFTGLGVADHLAEVRRTDRGRRLADGV